MQGKKQLYNTSIKSQKLSEYNKALREIIEKISFEKLNVLTPDAANEIDQMADTVKKITDSYNYISMSIFNSRKLRETLEKADKFIPYVKEEIEILHKQHKMEKSSVEDVLRLINLDCTPLTQLNGKSIDNPYVDLINKARERFEKNVPLEAFKEELPKLQSRLPSSHVIPNNRLANELQHNVLFGKKVDLTVANKGKTNEITTYVMATVTPLESGKLTGKTYSEYDRQVQNAVCSLYFEGNEYITAPMIYRAMTHRTQTETPSPQQIGAVTKSIEKQWRSIFLEINATNEVTAVLKSKNQKVDPNTKFKWGEYLLNLRRLTVESSGSEIAAYQILNEPILLKYSRLTGQLITVDASLLDIKKLNKKGEITTVSINNTESRISVKGYLLRRIGVIKNDKKNKRNKQSNIILFKSMFEEAGITQANRKTEAREYTFKALDFWKATGHIKDYKKRIKGRSFDAVIIET